MPEFTGHRDLRAYLRILWRWKLLFLVLVVAAPAAAYFIERGKPKVYRSTALVGVNQATVNTALLNGGGSFSTTNVTAIAQLVVTIPVARVAAALLHPPANPDHILSEVSAAGDVDTNFLRISAEDPSSTEAAKIANAFARAISRNRQRAAVSEIDSAINAIQAQLLQQGGRNTSVRLQLAQQLNQLRAARATQGSEAAILQAARPSPTPAGPHVRRTVELGLVIGLLLALGAVSLAENADRRLRTPDDLESMTDLPLLAAIAPSAFSGKLDTSPADDEAFHMLRTALTYYNIDRRLESVLVTSPGEKDGKTTVATRLALATARAGQHVILVDADLRRAQVSAKLGVQRQAGLAEVLVNELALSEALVEFPIADPGGGRLTVLPAGPPPPNPAVLLSSGAMQQVMRQLESRCQLVIIDSPAALAVSDPVPLMRGVTGVIVVARMNRSSRDTVRRLQRMIENAHGSMLGVVATGVAPGPGYEHYSPKYYTRNGKGQSVRRGWLRRQKRATQPNAASEPSE